MPPAAAPPTRAGVPATAFTMACFRAEMARSRDALYTDPWSELLVDREAWENAAAAARAFPAAKLWLEVRTRFFDDALRAAARAGCRQAVLLGSGLDTRPLRLAATGSRFWEVDAGPVLEHKRRRLEAHGAFPPVRYLPGDYREPGLGARLRTAGVDAAAPVFVLWEGNITYLGRDEIVGVMAELRGAFPRAALAFDYMRAEVVAGASGHAGLDAYVAGFAARGAPWRTGLDRASDLAGAGWRVAEDVDAARLHARYRPGVPPPAAPLGLYSLARLEVQYQR